MQSESPIAFAVLRDVQPILVSIQKSFDSCSDLHTGRTVACRCSDMHAVVIDIDTESNDSAGILIVEIKIGSECQNAMPGLSIAAGHLQFGEACSQTSKVPKPHPAATRAGVDSRGVLVQSELTELSDYCIVRKVERSHC